MRKHLTKKQKTSFSLDKINEKLQEDATDVETYEYWLVQTNRGAHRKNSPVGKVFETVSGDHYLILSGTFKDGYEIIFKETGFKRRISGAQHSTRRIKDPLKAQVFGLGRLGSASSVGENEATYKLWSRMLERITKPEDDQIRTISGPWTYFDAFLDWHTKQITDVKAHNPEYTGSWALDTDIHAVLGNGIKHYSPETTVLLPQAINWSLGRILLNCKAELENFGREVPEVLTGKGFPRGIGIKYSKVHRDSDRFYIRQQVKAAGRDAEVYFPVTLEGRREAASTLWRWRVQALLSALEGFALRQQDYIAIDQLRSLELNFKG
jgi:hypothetical protein